MARLTGSDLLPEWKKLIVPPLLCLIELGSGPVLLVGQAVEPNPGNIRAKPLRGLHREDQQVDARLRIGLGCDLLQLGFARRRVP